MATESVRDVSVPFVETSGGDFAVVTGDDLVRQRIQRGLTTDPWQFHDQDWGAGLLSELNSKGTPEGLDAIRRRAARFLDTVPGVTGYDVDVIEEGGGQYTVQVAVEYEGRTIQLPEIKIA